MKFSSVYLHHEKWPHNVSIRTDTPSDAMWFVDQVIGYKVNWVSVYSNNICSVYVGDNFTLHVYPHT